MRGHLFQINLQVPITSVGGEKIKPQYLCLCFMLILKQYSNRFNRNLQNLHINLFQNHSVTQLQYFAGGPLFAPQQLTL